MRKLVIGLGLALLLATAALAAGDTVVWVTKTGKCYHVETCASLAKSKIESTVAKAKAKGLRPCKNCNPPAK